jgi:predicted ArsR family transcriptional regulator
MSTRDVIRVALTTAQDPLTSFEIARDTGLCPLAVRHELVAMQQAGEAEAVWPTGPDRPFWALTADTALRAVADDLAGSTA